MRIPSISIFFNFSLVSPCMHRYQVLRTCGTHTRVTPCTRQREDREWPFSLRRDRARYRSCNFQNGHFVADHCGKRSCARIIARKFISRRRRDRGTIDDRDRESIGDSSARQNVGLHHRLFLLLRRITAPGAADDNTPGRVQAFQVCIVRRCIILAESWKKWHRGRRNYFLRRKIASRLGKLFYIPENTQTFQIYIVKGKIICEGNSTKMKEIIQWKIA